MAKSEPEYIQYSIIKALKIDDLETHVSVAMKNGWRPQGGVYVLASGLVHAFYQAIVSDTPVQVSKR